MQPVFDLVNMIGMVGLSAKFLIVIILAGFLAWCSRSGTTGSIISSAAVCAIAVEIMTGKQWGTAAFFIFLVIWAFIALIAWHASSSKTVSVATNGQPQQFLAEIAVLEPRYFEIVGEGEGTAKARKLLAIRISQLYTSILLEASELSEESRRRVNTQLITWVKRTDLQYSPAHSTDLRAGLLRLLELLDVRHDDLTKEGVLP